MPEMKTKVRFGQQRLVQEGHEEREAPEQAEELEEERYAPAIARTALSAVSTSVGSLRRLGASRA